MDNNLIKKDRLRYTKNAASANLAYLAILFDVLYFVSIYSSNNEYYYDINIGISVIYNLLFLLFVFLSSEGLKNYKLGYAIAIIGIGLMQLVRIFGIPLGALKEALDVGGKTVMEQGQFNYVVTMLILSAACCVAAGVIGIVRSHALASHNKKIASGEVVLEYNK